MALQTAVVSGPILQELPVAGNGDALQSTRDVGHACLQGGVCKGRLTPRAVMSEYCVTLKHIGTGTSVRGM